MLAKGRKGADSPCLFLVFEGVMQSDGTISIIFWPVAGPGGVGNTNNSRATSYIADPACGPQEGS